MANIVVCAYLGVAVISLFAIQGSRSEVCPPSLTVLYPPKCPRTSDSVFAKTCCTRKDSHGHTIGTCCVPTSCTNGNTGRKYSCPVSGTSKDKDICCTTTVNGKTTYGCCNLGDLRWYVWLIIGVVAFVIFLAVTCCICCCCSCCALAQRRQARGGYVIVQ